MAAVAEGATVGGVNEALERAGARIAGSIPVGGILVVQVEGGFERLSKAVGTLRESLAISAASEDLVVGTADLPPQPANPQAAWCGWSWTVPPSDGNWFLEWIRAPAVWGLYQKLAQQRCSPTATVAVLDNGIAEHPDLPRLILMPEAGKGDPINHGMAVAGVIAAGPLRYGSGIVGVNPWARVVAQNSRETSDFAKGASVLWNGEAAGLLIASREWRDTATLLLSSAPEARALNLSMGWTWHLTDDQNNVLYSYHPNDRDRPSIDKAVDDSGAMAERLIQGLVDKGRDVLFVVSAGNGRSLPPYITSSKYANPFTVAWNDTSDPEIKRRILVVEAIGDPSGAAAAFSQLGGNISAPGAAMWLLAAGGYQCRSGTSFSAPTVTGVASLLWMFRPTLSAPEVYDLLTDPRNTQEVAGPPLPARGVDALSAVLALDGSQTCGEWKRALVDVDDRTRYGRRLFLTEGVPVPWLGGYSSIGDGQVDMRDVRAYRTAQVHYLVGLEPATHPKLDLNHDGRTRGADRDPEHYARFDFNGDGQVNAGTSSRVRGRMVTDVDLLADCFQEPDEGWRKQDLPLLGNSGDVELKLDALQADLDQVLSQRSLPGPVDRVELRFTGTSADGHPALFKTLTPPYPADLLLTIPVPQAGKVTLQAKALTASGPLCAKLSPDLIDVAPGRLTKASLRVACKSGEACCDSVCCPAGTSCSGGACVEPVLCGGTTACNAPNRCCGSTCWGVDVGVTWPVCLGCDKPCPRGIACCDLKCCAPGEQCCGGQCAARCCPSSPTRACTAAGTDWCGGAVVNTLADLNNCGYCGNACAAGYGCCDGACVLTNDSNDHCGACGQRCGNDQVCCNGSCVSTSCAGCGWSGCAATDQCCYGSCIPQGWTCNDPCAGITCPTGYGCHRGFCLNLQTDPRNCGTIGNACASGTYCAGGQCVTPAQMLTDPARCGTVSPGSQPSTQTCSAGNACCGGLCTDLNTDPDNCGACGNVCPHPASFTTSNLVSPICCAGKCVDPSSDTANCGSCGGACAQGEGCCGGSCQKLDQPYQCGACGATCFSYVDPSAPPGSFGNPTCCGNQCVDTSWDERHCGGCGKACPQGQACCASACVDVLTDDFNCGECLNKCESSGEPLRCCEGACRKIKTDVGHCGGCGKPCEGGSCLQGACVCSGP